MSFKTDIPKEEKRVSNSLISTPNMVILLKEMAKMHGIQLSVSQAHSIIKDNELEISGSALRFCSFFEEFVKSNKPKLDWV